MSSDPDFMEDGLQRTLLYNNNEGLKTIIDGESAVKTEQLQLVTKRWRAMERAYIAKKNELELEKEEKRHNELEKKMLNLKVQSLTKAAERIKEIPEELQREKSKTENLLVENDRLNEELKAEREKM